MSPQSNSTIADPTVRRVLNVGCGPISPSALHPTFRNPKWVEVRLDIDERVKPDLVASVTDMKPITDSTIDAVWSSHNLEHLFGHEISRAMVEFRRVLKPSGFALITCPDLEEVAALVANGKGEQAAYQSPVGPITPLDMLYGHGPSIENGNVFMAHKTGFTADRLGRLLVEAGFEEVFVTKGAGFDLWALALMPDAEPSAVQHELNAHGLNFFPDPSES